MKDSNKFILNLKKETLLKVQGLKELELNKTGFDFIYHYLNKKGSSYIEALSNKYNVDKQTIKQDFTEFFEYLLQSGFDISKNNTTINSRNINKPSDTFLYKKLSTPICHIIQNCNSPCRICDC